MSKKQNSQKWERFAKRVQRTYIEGFYVVVERYDIGARLRIRASPLKVHTDVRTKRPVVRNGAFVMVSNDVLLDRGFTSVEEAKRGAAQCVKEVIASLNPSGAQDDEQLLLSFDR